MGESITDAIERVKGAADLRRYCESVLTPRGKTWVCPVCGSGTGPKATPAFSIRGQKWKCFSCGSSGDVIDLAGYVNGLEDTEEKVEAVASWAGVDGWQRGGGRESGGARQPAKAPDAPIEARVEEGVDQYVEGRRKVAEYIRTCQQRLTMLDPAQGVVWADERAGAYLEERGIDAVSAGLCGFGYDPGASGGKDASGGLCEKGRIVIPWTEGVGPCPDEGVYYYTARSLDPNVARDKYLKPKNDDVGGQPKVSDRALDKSVVFVVEGLMDAYAALLALDSSPEAGVIPLGGVGNAASVASTIAARRYGGTVVLMLDNDEKGIEKSKDMEAALEAAGVSFVSWPWKEGEHDPADSFRDDRAGFGSEVRAWAGGRAAEVAEERKLSQASETMTSTLTDPIDVLFSIHDLEDALDPLPTGLYELDHLLGGGLQPGSLHVVAAASSAGKTTLTLQICDFLAQHGTPVLFVTVEQRPDELVAKSLARVSASIHGVMDDGASITAMGMRNRLSRSKWSLDQLQRLRDAEDFYAGHIAPNVRFMYPNEERTSVEEIGKMASLMQIKYGKPPAIFIDYLQLLAPPDGFKSQDVRLAVDENIRMLRRLASILKVPVWVVSSVGRGAYFGSVDMGSFKESSGIEFGADVALGLQPRDMAEETSAAKTEGAMRQKGKQVEGEAREKSVRPVELLVLKNRFGPVRPLHGIPLTYHCARDLFRPEYKGQI